MIQTPAAKMHYLKCAKTGLHEDQSLNVVCLENSCLENLICCCACLQSDHKKHRTKPLKMLIHEVRSQTSQIKHHNINIDIMVDIAKNHQQQNFELFKQYKRDILDSLEAIQSALNGYYSLTIDQILLYNSDNNILMEEALEKASAPKNIDELRTSMKKIIALAGEPSKGQQLSEDELKTALGEASASIKRSLQAQMSQVNKQLTNYHNSITKIINSTNIWQKAFRFSPTLKHPNIQILNDTTAKVIQTAGYKFALLEPGVGKTPLKSFHYNITKSTSNWVAVGFCYRRIVEKNKFSFTFGAMNQGAYLASSNGGSWSHSRPEHNNTLKSIKFGVGDTVTATLDQHNCSIIFTNKANEKHQLPYDPLPNDQLYPCVLFYYNNDQVQYLSTLKL